MTPIQEIELTLKVIQLGLRELDALPKLSPERPIVFLALERDVADLQELWKRYGEAVQHHGELR